MEVLDDARETLEALRREGAKQDATFLRMVAWYRALTDEMGCRDAFEEMLLALLASSPRRAGGTAPVDRRRRWGRVAGA
jgi:hypothetical protein